MPRDFRVFLEDIRDAIDKIRRYTPGMSYESFCADERTVDAVVRNLEVIGEAVKHLPPEIRVRRPGIEWTKIAGLRDVLAHEYFGVDLVIVWDILQTKIEDLDRAVGNCFWIRASDDHPRNAGLRVGYGSTGDCRTRS